MKRFVILLVAALALAGCDTLESSFTALQTSIPPAGSPPRSTPTQVVQAPTPRRETPAPGVSTVVVVVPSDIALRYMSLNEQGYTRGITEDNVYFLGAANAPVVIEQFSSYSCPPCMQFNNKYFHNLFDMIAAAQVKYIFYPVTSTGHFDPTNMAKAALCAGEQGHFWQMHDLMFDWQERYGEESNEEARLTKGIEGLGLDTAAFSACFKSSEITQQLEKVQKIAEQRGIDSTPTIFLNGERLELGFELTALRERIDKLSSPR